MPNEIPLVFYNRSDYEYHFIMNELAKKFKGQFECCWENAEKYKTFSVPIKKEIKVDKDGYENIATVFSKFKFIERARSITRSILLIISQILIKLNANILVAFF